MIDLSKKVLPDSVTVSGSSFKIKTDFHYWIRFIQMLNEKVFYEDFDFLYKEGIPEDRKSGFESLKAFAFPKRELPRSTESENPDLISYSYTLDADLIYSAFMQQYGIDLVDSSMHWYKFQALFNGLRECKFTDVVGYRLYEVKGKETAYDKQMLKMRKAWEILPELTEEDKKRIDDFNKLF